MATIISNTRLHSSSLHTVGGHTRWTIDYMVLQIALKLPRITITRSPSQNLIAGTLYEFIVTIIALGGSTVTDETLVFNTVLEGKTFLVSHGSIHLLSFRTCT